MGGKSGGGGGGGGSNQSTTTTNQPWSGVAPSLQNMYSDANSAYSQTPKQPWAGPTAASPRPETIAGQDYALQMANSMQGAGTGTMNLASDMISGKFLDPNQNPYFQNTVNAAFTPVEQQFYNQTMPALKDQAISQGAYGGDREGITSALASNTFTRNLADTSANMAWQNYANERSLQMWAPQLMQEGESLNMMPSQIYGDVGGARQQTEQDMLNQAYGLYQGQQAAPWTGLSNLSNILQGSGAGQGSSTTTSTGGTPSWLQGGLGGAGLGAAVGNMILPAGSGLSSYAPFIGGGSLLGAALGFI